MTGLDVAKLALYWLNTPYLHQGRNGQGLDCIGLIIVIAWELGIIPEDFDYQGYSQDADGTLGRVIAKYCDRWKNTELSPGLLVVLLVDGEEHHVGVLGEYDPDRDRYSLIHTCRKRGKVVAEPFTKFWQDKVSSYWALPDVDYSGGEG